MSSTYSINSITDTGCGWTVSFNAEAAGDLDKLQILLPKAAALVELDNDCVEGNYLAYAQSEQQALAIVAAIIYDFKKAGWTAEQGSLTPKSYKPAKKRSGAVPPPPFLPT